MTGIHRTSIEELKSRVAASNAGNMKNGCQGIVPEVEEEDGVVLEIQKVTLFIQPVPGKDGGGPMYCYRWLLGDGMGKRITGLLAPTLHEDADLPAGTMVKLTEWELVTAPRKRRKKDLGIDGHEESQASTASFSTNYSTTSSMNDGEGGSEVVSFLKIQGFEIVEQENRPQDSQTSSSAQSFKSSFSSTATYQEHMERQLRHEQLRKFKEVEQEEARRSAAVNGDNKNGEVSTPVKKGPQKLPQSALRKRPADSTTPAINTESPSSGKKPCVSFDLDQPTRKAPDAPDSTTGSRSNLPQQGTASPWIGRNVVPQFSSAATIYNTETNTNSTTIVLKPRTNSIWNQLNFCKLKDLPLRDHGSKVDILAIVESIDSQTIKRNRSTKRDCRLTDLTFHKPTILSVWVRPDRFYPSPGTLIAFRGLTVHRYDGRSLNAFSDVAGSVWYWENPDIDGAEELKERYEDEVMRRVLAKEGTEV